MSKIKTKFSDYNLIIKTELDYEIIDEPVEIIQITGIADEEQIEKIKENFTPEIQMNFNKELKRGDIIWLTALLKKPGSSYNPQTIGLVKVRIVDLYYGLNKLNYIK
jgi:hypothetical protein